MKNHFKCERLACLLLVLGTMASAYAVDRSYYAALNNTSGSGLLSAVQSATAKGFKTVSYNALYTAYQQTDVYPADSVGKAGLIWDIYGGCGFAAGDKCGTYKYECDCYNREHGIPQSSWGGGESGIGCDIFHVIPTDGKVNGMRGNYPFGEVGSATYSYNGNKRGSSVATITNSRKTICAAAGSTTSASVGTVFEPQDQFKGDFARSYFGTIMKWGTTRLTQGNAPTMFRSTMTEQTAYGLTPYAVALLMKWHREDPVSAKEIARNNGIQATQGNRNPFIDFPYLAEYIWGEHAGETLRLDSLVASFEPGFVPGQSNGWGGKGTGSTGGGIVTPTTYTATWMVRGAVYTGGTIVACSEGDDFVGWTAQPISGQAAVAPTDLFTSQEQHPELTQDQTYYAVFATRTGGAADVTSDISLGAQGYSDKQVLSETQVGDVTLSYAGGGTSPTYYVSGDAVRIYAGATLTVSATAAITEIELEYTSKETANTLTLTSGGGTWQSPTWTGNATSVTFTVGGSKGHIKLAAAHVTYGGGYTYSTYFTSCPGSEMGTGDPNALHQQTAPRPAEKVLLNGRIYLRHAGHLYDPLGHAIRF